MLKFDGAGKFLFQIGKHGVHNGSNDVENFWQPTKIWEDVSANEMYVGDGYGNRRVIVFDVATGKYKRHWGAYGNKPSDEKMPAYNPKGAPSKQFNTVHCAIVSNDGLVYVCDRVNDRIQVFHKDGTFVKEVFIDPNTYRSGSVWDLTFSRDPQQTYIYAANGVDEKINILLRSSLEVLTSFGDGGRGPGSSSASTTWRPIRRATSTPPRPTPARASSVSFTRESARSRRRSRGSCCRRPADRRRRVRHGHPF